MGASIYLVASIVFGRVLPSQAVADHIDDPANDLSIIDPRHAMTRGAHHATKENTAQSALSGAR